MEIIARDLAGNHRQRPGETIITTRPGSRTANGTTHQNLTIRPQGKPRYRGNRRPDPDTVCMDWTTWWLWRGARTRSLPELGRENPQRPWYCVSRHGRVGRRQVFQSMHKINARHKTRPRQPANSSRSNTAPRTNHRGTFYQTRGGAAR